MDYKQKILDILEKFETEYAEPARQLVLSATNKTPFEWFLMYQTLVEELVDATGQGSKEIDAEIGGKQYKFKDLNEMLGHLQKEGPTSKMKAPDKKQRGKCKKHS